MGTQLSLPPLQHRHTTTDSLFTQHDIEQALQAASQAGRSHTHPVPTWNPSRHGTHVASVAAGRPTPHFIGGIAPNAKLLVVIPRAIESIPYIAALGFIAEYAKSRWS